MNHTSSAQPDVLLPDWLLRAAQSFPERPALISDANVWTFADLDQHSLRLARTLAAQGIGDGARVALLASNSFEFVAVVHAVRRLGAILVPLNTRLSASELAWQIEDVRAAFLLHDAAQQVSAIATSLPTLARASLHALFASDEDAPSNHVATTLRHDIDLNATQAIVYTSGTTGRPKGALITHGMQWWSATASALNLGLRDDDRWLACLPFFHVGGLSLLMKSTIYGMPLVVFDHFDAHAVNTAIVRHNVTMISVVAVMLRRMLDALDEGRQPGDSGRYPSALRCVLLGGGPAPLPLLEDCARRGIPVAQTYGLTESCSQAATLAPADALRKLGSAGKPLLPVFLRIVADDPEATIASVGEVGEIEIRGPTITTGYDAQPEATAAALHDGWFRTGDLGYLDADGYLYVLDRRGDLIVSGGENVYPAEIEAALIAHPDVLDAGVRGVPDERWGRVPLAFVHLRAGAAPSERALLTFLGQRLARYKLPRAIRFTGPLPRNAAGKLLRRELPSA